MVIGLMILLFVVFSIGLYFDWIYNEREGSPACALIAAMCFAFVLGVIFPLAFASLGGLP